MTTETDHGRNNAKAWAESIAEMVAALECDYDRLEELSDERQALIDACGTLHSDHDTAELRADRNELDEWIKANGEELAELTAAATIDGARCESADAARERIEESPLSIQVRSGWVNPGEKMQAEEFEILLTTGGPALRIRGELDEHMQPCRAWLEYQDWRTPWTQYFDVEQSTLLTFASVFYFGE